MIINASIPENLTSISPILTQHLSPLLHWFSDAVYDRLIPSDSDHLLCTLHTILDFSPLEAACADYHKLNGKGRSVSHTVPKLLRAMLVKYLYNLSLRQLEERIRYDMLTKWFVGYPVFADPPDHSTLSRFELYLVFNHPRLFFDTVLRQIDAAFPEDRTRPQIGDTFAMHANAALESLVKRLRHAAQEMLRAYHTADLDAYTRLWLQLDEAALFGVADEKTECTLSSEQRQQRLLLTVDAVLRCLHLLEQTAAPSEIPPSVQTWMARLVKILGDELHLERDENGRLIHVSLLPKKKRGTYCICSAADPEATIRNHGPDKQDFGYNISVAATTHFIREIQADTGARPDAAPIPELLCSQIEHHDVCPDKFIYDMAAGRGKTVHLVTEATDGRTQLVAKPVPGKRKEGRFAPEDFALSADGLSLTCPHGRTSCRKYRSGSGDGHNFRFVAAQCLGCPFWQPCRGKDETPTTPRNVFISDYRSQWNQLVAYSQTDAFKEDMALRPQVERKIADLVLHNGARQARFRGLVKVDFQAKMCAASANLKQWVSLLHGKRRKKRRRFGAPTPSHAARSAFKGEVGLMAA
jgi:hypothetical protein